MAYTGSVSENDERSEENFNIEDSDKYGGVNQKDLDQITGGMQVVRESKINLNSIERMIPPEEAFGRPSQGRLSFLVT